MVRFNWAWDAEWVGYPSQVVRLMCLYRIASVNQQFGEQTLSIAELREQLARTRSYGDRPTVVSQYALSK